MISLVDDVSVLSDQDLLSYSIKLARHESDVGLRIIACLREAEKRMLHSQLGMSLWEYATECLGLSNGNAQMKIDAMRLSRDNYIAHEKIQSGELSIVNAAKVNSFLRQERKSGNVYTSEQKAEVIESVLGLSQSQCEQALLARNPKMIPTEKVRTLTETKTELRMVVEEKTIAILDRLKDLLSNKMPNANYAELVNYLAREKVEALEKKAMGVTLEVLSKSEQLNESGSVAKNNRESAETSKKVTTTGGVNIQKTLQPSVTTLDEVNTQVALVSASGKTLQFDTTNASGVETQITLSSISGGKLLTEATTTGGVGFNKQTGADLIKHFNAPTLRKYIPIEDRRWVMRRAQGRCEHVAENGRRCGSRRRLQYDHVIPLFLGGTNSRENLRVVCRSCNLFYAKQHLGSELMKKYVSSLR